MSTVSSRQGGWAAVDLAYAAGFFDGEGAVSIMPTKSRRGRGFKAVSIVVQTDRSILEWFVSQFGGRIYSNNFKAKPATWRPGYQWPLSGDDAREFLVAIRPYLRLKPALVDNTLAFLELKRQASGRRRTPDDLMVRMAELHAIHRALIQRGRLEPSAVPEVVPSPQLEMLA